MKMYCERGGSRFIGSRMFVRMVISLLVFALKNQIKEANAYVIHYEEPPPPPQRNYNSISNDLTEVKVCDDIECQVSGSDSILQNMNLSADPCADFYEYACGNWIKNNPIPPSRSHFNQFQLAEDKLHLQIKEILENSDLNANEVLPVKAASLYYKSCINTERIEEEGMRQLIGLLSSYGEWPMTVWNWDMVKFNWLIVCADSIKRFSVASLFNIYVGLDRLDSSQRVILIDQPTFLLPRSILTEYEAYKIQLEAYKEWIAATAWIIAEHIRQNVSLKQVETDALDVLQFEMALAKLTSSKEMRKNAFRMYNSMTIRDLQEWTDSASRTFKIDWLVMIRRLFCGDGAISIDYNERIIVKELDFFFRLAKLLQNTPSRTIANYLQWRLLSTFSADSTKEMRSLVSQFDQVFFGIKQNEPRWKDCITSVSNVLNFAVGYAYVKEHFDEETKTTAKEMVKNIVDAFSHQLENAEWMDDQTKQSALQKVKNMNLFIGYPESYNNVSALFSFYDGLSVGSSHFENVEQVSSFLYKQSYLKLRQKVDRNEWITGPAIVNAFNNGYTNTIILPAGILQLPFFDSKRIMAMNYGSIGAVIGHEILHSFDDTGRLTDKYGNLAQWWTEDVIITYEKKKQCFIDQYNKFMVPIIGDPNTPIGLNQTSTTYWVNGMYTQGENIADNSGLRQSFFAYKKYVEENGEEKHAHYHTFSPEQLFFISYATAWCESNTKESLMQEILDDPHSPHKIRVTGTLSNSAEFANAFKCAETSPMNPKKKCIIW